VDLRFKYDSHGEINSLFPTSGNVENQEPSNISPTPTEIRLEVNVIQNWRTVWYRYVSIIDQSRSDTEYFHDRIKSVKTRGATRGNPLTDLLSNVVLQREDQIL